MKTILYSFIATFFLINFCFKSYGQKFDDKEPVRIGFILDGENQAFYELEKSIKKEIEVLVSSKFKDLTFPTNKRVLANFNDSIATIEIDRLLIDPEVDIIIGIGTIVAVNISRRGDLSKPTIAIGIINPRFQEIPLTSDQTSGVDNFNYITLPFSPKRDMEVFSSIIQFKNLGIMFSKNILNSIPKDKSARYYFDNLIKDMGFEYKIIPVSIDSMSFESSIPEGIDAVYTGLFFDFSEDQIRNIYKSINAKRLPSFALGGQEYVKLGAMASVSSEQVGQRISRRTALNIEKILDEKNPKNIPVIVKYTQSLVLNQRTMNQINFYPNWDILSEAEVLFENESVNLEVLRFKDVIYEAIEKNLDLKVASLELESDSKEINLARANLLPQLDISASGVLIDKYRASSSLGQNPERSGYGTASLSQLIYSAKAFANLKIQKRVYESMEFGYQSTEMDIVLDVSTIYLNVLQAISMETIARENLKSSRKNLEIARMRESVGYSGTSDVYRWESKIASDKIELLSANETRRLTEYALMEMLNRPFEQRFSTDAIDINDTSIFVMSDASISMYIDNMRNKELFRNFLVDEALSNVPELKQLDAAIAAQERYLTAAKRSHFLPDVGISAQADYDFYRGGEGSTVDPIEIPIDPDEPPLVLDMFSEPEDFSWNIGVNATLPISQGGRLHIDRQQAEIELLKLKEDRYNISRKFTRQVVSLFERASLSYPKIELSASAAEYAMKSYNIVQDSYSHGVVSITQLLDAQQAAVQANSYASISIYTYLIDVLALQRAMGKFFILHPLEETSDFFYRLDEYISDNQNSNSQ